MGKIINSSATTGNRINFFGGRVQSDESWLEALPVDVVRGNSRYSGKAGNVWVSAGASYGAQVEFSNFAVAQAFIDANPGTTRLAMGTNRPRVVCDTVTVFVAAYKAASGTRVAEAVKAAKADTSALIDPVLAAAMVEVEEEEAQTPVSRKDEVTAQLEAMGKTPEFIAKVLAKMGL